LILVRGARAADVEDVLAELHEHRLHLGEVCGSAPTMQLSCLPRRDAACERRVDEGTPFAEVGADAVGGSGLAV
jgi:hypothetical protein